MKPIPPLALTLAGRNGGATAVEFAIVSSTFIAMIIGAAYVGIMMFTNLAVHWAVEKGARLAAINSGTTQSAVSSSINGYLSSMGVAAATVTYSVTNGAFPVATVAASLTEIYTIPFVSRFTITYSANTTVPQGS